MQAHISVQGVTLEYPTGKGLRLLPAPKPKNPPKSRSDIGGDFVFGHGRRNVRSLDNVSFELNAGDRVALVGANGAGKSSLLMCLAGIYEPTHGVVETTGKVDALFNIQLGFRPEASGLRNIYLRGLVNGWTEKEIRDRTPAIVDFSELQEFIEMPFGSYSQGMAARLAFAIATAVECDILLLDEWIGAGDPAFQEKARKRMNRLVSKAGILVLASHSYPLIRKTCNKAIRLHHGRIEASGTVDEILGDLQ